MPQNPPEGFPRITPYLYYEDGVAAIEFLTGAFGFTERFRMAEDDGRIGHAELELDGGVVMLGTPSDYRNPKRLGGKTQSLYVYVDDVDAHFAHAKEAGATILREPTDQFYGDRNYGVEDPEGHEWYFGTHVRDVTPEEMAAATAEPATAS
jgi:PhnB protein